MGVPNLELLFKQRVFLRNHFVFTTAFPDDFDFTFSLHQGNRIALQGFAHHCTCLHIAVVGMIAYRTLFGVFSNVEHAFPSHPDIGRQAFCHFSIDNLDSVLYLRRMNMDGRRGPGPLG